MPKQQGQEINVARIHACELTKKLILTRSAKNLQFFILHRRDITITCACYNFHSKQLRLGVYFFAKIEFSSHACEAFNAQSAIQRTMQGVTESFLG